MATTDPILDTELPAAVALSDTLANPTAPAVAAWLVGWDGTQGVRLDVTAAGLLKVVMPIPNETATGISGIVEPANGNNILAAGVAVKDSSGWIAERSPDTFKSIASTSVTAGSPVAGWTPASGKKFRLMGYALSLSVAGSVVLQDATTEKIRTPLMPAGIGQPSPAMGNGILSAAANNSLNLDVTATGTVSGFLFGTEE